MRCFIPWTALLAGRSRALHGVGSLSPTCINSAAKMTADFRKTPVLELLRTRLNILSEDGQLRAGRSWPFLKMPYGNGSSSLHPSLCPLLIERTWYSLGGRECVDKTAYENTQVFFDMLDQMSADGIACINGELERKLTRLFAQPDSESSELNGVQLMTIHKAKGSASTSSSFPDCTAEHDRNNPSCSPGSNAPFRPSEVDGAGEVSEILVAPIGEKGQEIRSVDEVG